jgi:DNA-directed RNA polymerase specialized sigma24 family protein
MPMTTGPSQPAQLLPLAQQLAPALIAGVHERSGAGRWGVSVESFGTALSRSVARASVPADETERFVLSLHHEDLALAVACLDGLDVAWEHLVRHYQPVLAKAADAMDRTGGARELADALYGDLCGATAREGTGRSVLSYFHGRSSLATWLRAVLAQRFVDRVRAARRLEALPDEPSEAAREGPVSSPLPAAPDRERFVSVMRAAIGRAIAALGPRDRLRLSCYYAQGLTLAQTGCPPSRRGRTDPGAGLHRRDRARVLCRRGR